jgi:glutamate racemase
MPHATSIADVPLRPRKTAPRILIFDSGLGGLSVFGEIAERQPAADYIYVADDAAFPYGGWSEAALVGHIVALMGDLIAEHRPDLVVIACNTASTLVLPPLRARYAVPFVGTVPAIKPAAKATQTKLVSVLATPGTVARDYTRRLIDAHAAGIDVTLVGAERLAEWAEAWLRGETIDLGLVRAEISPCFRESDGARTDVVVLGCTHYPLILDLLVAAAPWPVAWIDGAAGIGRRVEAILADAAGPDGAREPSDKTGRIYLTSGADVGAALRARLETVGLAVAD